MFRLGFIAIVTIISACHYTPEVDYGERCSENREVAATFLSIIAEIRNKAELTTDDTKTLIRPLGENFNLDWGSCDGFTERVRRATKKVLSERADELTILLLELCSQSIPDDTMDVSFTSAIATQRKSAKKALEYIEKPTNQCRDGLNDDMWNPSLYK